MNTEMQKNTKKTTTPVPKRGKRLNEGFLSLRNDTKPGQETEGFFVQVRPLLSEGGEIRRGNFDQELFVMELRDTAGEIKMYWADAGIRGSLKMAKIQPDQYIFIVHTGTKKIEEGTVQTYDVFGSEN